MVTAQKIKKLQRIRTKILPEFKDLTYEERLREMHLNTLEKRRKRGDLITIYKFMNNLEKIDSKNIINIRKGEARNLTGNKKKLQKGFCLNKQYRCLEWTERRGNYGKGCTTTEEKTGQI